MKQSNFPAITAQQPATVNTTGSAEQSLNWFAASTQIITTGSAAGTFKLQASNDPSKDNYLNTASPTNWTDIPNASATISGAGTYLIPKTDICYEFVRAIYTSTATGSQTVALVADTSGSLNNTYFLLNSGNDTRKYYVWFDNGTGVDPAIAGRTAIHVTYTNNDTAATIGATMATQIAAAHSSGDFTTSGTSTVTITNQAAGPYTPATDGAVPTHFTFTVTLPTGTVSANMKVLSV